MQFIVENWMLVLVATSSGAMLLWPALQGAANAGLTPAGAVHLINREKAVVVDISEAEEFAAGHVGGSKSIPLKDLEEKLPTMVKNKGLPLILVCPRGARSTQAVTIAKKLGYEKAQALAGGLNAWKAATLPTEKA